MNSFFKFDIFPGIFEMKALLIYETLAMISFSRFIAYLFMYMYTEKRTFFFSFSFDVYSYGNISKQSFNSMSTG